jgi:hypothetical protein
MKSDVFRRAAHRQSSDPRAREHERRPPMNSVIHDLSLFAVFAIAEAFMVWFLWNFWKAGRRP